MSGFCGWLARDGFPDLAPARLERMAACLPAAPDAFTDVWLRPSAALALRGNPSESAWRDEGSLAGVIVGYPRWAAADVQAVAHAQGHASALLEAYRRHGRDLLQGLFGHFAFAVLDPARGRVFCAIDRFGVYRLCLATPRPGHFVFATSADALRTHPGVGATISPQTLYQYLFFIDRVAAPGTIYDEQSKLRPGEALLFEEGGLHRWRYWQLDYRRPARTSKAELQEVLRDHLGQAVARALEGERAQRTATFLSGGLDSSTVAGFFAKARAGQGRCVTIGFEHAEFDETSYAKAAAQHFGLKHEIFVVGPREVLDALPKLAMAYDEPYSNSSVIPCYYCAKVSKEAGSDMILAGDGGDELFGGNTRYLKDGVFDRYLLLPALLRRGLLEPTLARLPGRRSLPLLRQLSNYVELARCSVAHRMVSHNAFAFTPVDRVFSAEAFAAIDADGPAHFAEALYDDAAGDDKIQRMMHLDLQLTLADSDLRKVMTSCSVAGIRVRFPMLDDDLAEFSGTLPAALLTEGGRIRRFYKGALAGFLPQVIIDKPKMGFGLPVFPYIATLPALADFLCNALADLKRRYFFDNNFLDRMIEEVRQGRPGTHAGVVWDLAVLETWMSSRGISTDGTADAPLAPPGPAARKRVHQG